MGKILFVSTAGARSYGCKIIIFFENCLWFQDNQYFLSLQCRQSLSANGNKAFTNIVLRPCSLLVQMYCRNLIAASLNFNYGRTIDPEQLDLQMELDFFWLLLVKHRLKRVVFCRLIFIQYSLRATTGCVSVSFTHV